MCSKSYFHEGLIKTILISGTIFVATSVHAAAPFLVTNGNDSGNGSLRQALAEASESRESAQIIIETKDDIVTETTLQYTGKQALEILGAGQNVATEKNITIFSATNGADLSISNLNFNGPGKFSIKNRGDLNGIPGKGIFVDMRDDQTGVVHLALNNVAVSNVAYHGIHVSDCSLADKCGGGGSGDGDGSEASVNIALDTVRIENVGNGMFDGDGLRVDERGEGGIIFVAHNSSFTKVGADGVELDEAGNGDVTATVVGSKFLDNGGYCDGSLLKPFLPAKTKAKFKDGDMMEKDVPPAITGSADDRCFEREVKTYDSGAVKKYEFAIDFDDAFDIDESDDGDLTVVMVDTIIKGNLDEGADMDEAGNGSIFASYVRTSATGNTDDGFKMSEEGNGDVSGLVLESQALNNGGKGIVYEEEEGGNLLVEIHNSTTAKNDDGDKTGLEIVQDGEGSGTLIVKSSKIEDGMTIEGVNLTQ